MLGNYFQITPTTAYGSTIYVHSHARSLKYEGQSAAYQSALKHLYTACNSTKNDVLKLLNELIKGFEEETAALIKAGYPTKGNRPATMTEKFLQFRKVMMDFYAVATKAKTHKGKKASEESTKAFWAEIETQTDAKLQTILKNKTFETEADIIATRLAQMLNKKKWKAKAESVGLLQKEVEEMTAQEIFSIFSGKKGFILKDAKDDLNKKAMMALDELEEWNKLLTCVKEDYLKNSNVLKTKDPNLLSTVKTITESANSLLSKQGYLTELIVGFQGEGSNPSQVQFNNQLNGNKIDINLEVLGKKNAVDGKKYEYGDAVTTDIRTVIKGLADRAETIVGLSVKLNPAYFRKNENLTVNEINSSLPLLTDQQTKNSLVYFLTNYSILSKMAYPLNDKEYRKQYNNTGTMAAPGRENLLSMNFSILDDIQESAAILLFVKGVIGSLFFSNNFNWDTTVSSQGMLEQGLPLIIQTSVEQYWTKDLLIAIRDLANSTKARQAFDNFPKASSMIYGKTEQVRGLFTELFARKVDYANTHPVTKDYAGDRYAEIASDSAVSNVMKNIIDLLWTAEERENVLNKIIPAKALIRFNYNEYL